MFRNLIIILAIVAVVWIVRGMIRRNQISQNNNKPRSSKNMVQCEQCGTYLPEDDAVVHDGRYFCGQKHLQTWKDHH